MLPPKLHECIHMMFTLMGYRHHPHNWKESHTCLLYKNKGEPTDITVQASRLLNTIYRTLAQSPWHCDYAEKHSVLSSTQKGFRKYASTMSQVQTLIMALEDARDTAQDVYMLQVDFSNAFNMIDHDKLLRCGI
jgi:hypothetical protein